MKISVLTPSFNSGKYLSRSIDSVLKQDYTNWEHIVTDGGSTDDTLSILKSYPHLLWTSEQDEGQSDAMNKAFDMSTGDLVIYLNADDELNEGHFSIIVKEFNEHPEADMIVFDLRVDNQGNISKRSASIKLRTILRCWPTRFPLNPVAYAYRRELQKEVGPFPLNNHYSMDYWFLLRAYKFGKILKRKSVGGTFYLDGDNKSAQAARAKASVVSVRNKFVISNLMNAQVLQFLALQPVHYLLGVLSKLRIYSKTIQKS